MTQANATTVGRKVVAEVGLRKGTVLMFISHLPVVAGAIALVALGIVGPGIIILALVCGMGMPVMVRTLPPADEQR